VARAFEPDEVVRLSRRKVDDNTKRAVHYGSPPSSSAQRVVARELHRALLPAATARGLILVEGAHDLAAYSAITTRNALHNNVPPPEAYGLRLLDPGPEGGVDRIPTLSALARSLGFRVVVVIDFDHDESQAKARLEAVADAADAVVRLPQGFAVEAALLDGVDDQLVRKAFVTLNEAHQLPNNGGWEEASAELLRKQAIKALKSNNGLHRQYIEALDGPLPPVAAKVVAIAVELGRLNASGAFEQL
jgi:hypothetical protein